jgi:SAM-dependent methyltransferase
MTNDAAFSGSIPAIYDQYLGPLLFTAYGEELANRIAALAPGRILETAAGTGIVTELVRRAVPDAELVETDLKPSMLDVAAKRIGSETDLFVANAQQLPFADQSFDCVYCQFGIMFFPDKVQGNREAHRVLRDGGTYVLAIWDSLDRNPVSRAVADAAARLNPADPPAFLTRGPFSYTDHDRVITDLHDGGFDDVSIEAVERTSRVDAEAAAKGLVMGSPLRLELEERGADLDWAVAEIAKALAPWDRKDGEMSALIVTATR